jgi:hypothetical protein
VVSVTLISVGNATVTAKAFGPNSAEVDSFSVTHGPGAGNGLGNRDRITLVADEIARVTFAITAVGAQLDGFGIDDLTFSSVSTQGNGPVPSKAAIKQP